MWEEYLEYLSQLYQRIPESVYLGGLSLFVLCLVLILSIVGFGKGRRSVIRLLLFEYIALIYCSTVIFRTPVKNSELRQASIHSYVKIFEGGGFHIHPEMFINVLVFVPLGILLCSSFRKIKWWQALIIGMCISISIEVLQFVLRRGTSEVADVIHNTLGCLIGIGIYYMLTNAYNKIKTKKSTCNNM